MKFSISLKGYVPSQDSATGKTSIRTRLQTQLAALKRTLSTFPALSANTRIYDGTDVYESVVPLDWTCEVLITLLRGMPKIGRTGIPDLDNLAKTLCDAIAAPHCPVGKLPIPAKTPVYVIALDDSQIVKMTISDDFHWASPPPEDIAIITVWTRQTDADTIVALGGAGPKIGRAHV